MEVKVPESNQSYRLYCSKNDGAGNQGVAIAIKFRLKEIVTGVFAPSPRILVMHLASSPIPTTVVAAYAPTNGASDTTKDALFC